MNAEVVLRENRSVPGVRVAGYRRILRQRTGQAEFKVSQSVIAHRPVEGEHAIIVQQRLLNVFVE